MSEKETTSPLERGTRKMDVLMRAFGMRTRIFKGSSRSIVKGTRKIYPYELNATVIETARGVGIRIQLEKLWYTFLKFIPFLLLIIISLLSYFVPSIGDNIASATGVNPFKLVLGSEPGFIGLWVVLPILGLIFIGVEILERIIRARYIQDKMPRFLSGAEWEIAEPPIVLDTVSASSNLLWFMYVIMILIFAPLSFSDWVYTKFLEVYKVESSAIFDTTILISILDIAILSGMMFSILYMNYEKFRGSLDTKQFRYDVRMESQARQMIQIATGTTILATFELILFYFMFWNNITVIQVIIFYALTVASSVLGTWLFWQKENYIFIALAIWFFLSDVVMIFLNANDPSYSWMIICHLFLILFIIGISLNRYFEGYLAKKGMYEPSWIFNPFPFFAFVTLFKKKKVRITKGVDKELEEIRDEEMVSRVREREPLTIDADKIKKKGKGADKIIQYYQKVLSRMVTGEFSILSITTLNFQILEFLHERKELVPQIKDLFIVIDKLLWEDNYKLQNGSKYVKIAEQMYEIVIKMR